MHRLFGNASAPSRTTFGNLLRHPWILAGLGSVTLLGMVTASAIVSRDDIAPEPVRVILERLATPTAVPVDPGPAEFVYEERIQRSDTLASLLSRLSINDPEALAFISQRTDTRAVVRQLRPGKAVTARTDGDGQLTALYFPLNGKDSTFVVERKGDGFVASEQTLPLTTQVQVKSGEIVSSLFGATDAEGIPDTVATQLAEIFSSDIDFYRDLRKGDKFSVVYESLTHNGQLIRTGRILAAEFVNDGTTYQAYWFQTEEGKGGYYSSEGKSLRKAFLRSPLEFSRVTSGFSGARKHPVLQTVRAHKGIDYGAPTGTPIRAVSDGIVEFAGRQNGYGNLVVLKHQGKYTTAYGHMNGFAQGIRTGTRVSQGDTIGFVGQTGLATGPHLHYEFRVDGQQINPLAASLPAAVPLNSAQLLRFKASTITMHTQLDLAQEVRLASLSK